MSSLDEVSRRSVRHAVMRARNTRIATDRDDRWPAQLHMSPGTFDELLVDGDPDEEATLVEDDTHGWVLMGVPVTVDPRLADGRFVIGWPTATPVPEEYR